MFRTQAIEISVVHLEPPVVGDLLVEAFTLQEMTDGVAVALGPCICQREVNHSPAQHGGSQRVFSFQRIRRWPQDLVVIAVELICSRENQFSGMVQCRPGNKEGQRLVRARIAKRQRKRTVLGLHVLKIGKTLEVCPQMRAIERALETIPAESLHFLRTPQCFEYV